MPSSSTFDLDRLAEQRFNLLLLALGVVVTALYARGLTYDFHLFWDDKPFVTGRPEIMDWWGQSWRLRLLTPEIGYPVPLPTVISALLHQLPESVVATAHHVVSLAFHLANLTLLALLTRRWFGPKIALFAATLWTVHPVLVESIAWATNLKTVTASFFVLSAMCVWERTLDRTRTPVTTGAAIVLLFALALGCRPDASILPALLGWQAVRLHGIRGALRTRGVFVGALLAIGGAAAVLGDRLHRSVLHSQSIIHDFDLFRDATIVGYAFEQNLLSLFLPRGLHPYYYYPSDYDWTIAMPGWALLLGVLGIWAWRARRGDRALVFTIGLALAMYVPYSQFVRVPRYAADTYLYLVSWPVIVSVVIGLSRFTMKTAHQRAISAVAAAVAIVLALVTAHQIERWSSPEALWLPVIEEIPLVWKPYATLAESAHQRGDLERTRELLQTGFPLFKVEGQFPWFMPLVVAQTGDPLPALNLAQMALLESRAVDVTHVQVYLDLAAAVGAEAPDQAVRDVIRPFIDTLTRDEQWLKERETKPLRRMERWGWSEEVEEILEALLILDSPPCDAFEMAAHRKMPAPPRPDRCREE